MVWFLIAVALLIALILLVWFLNVFYKKSSRDTALVRTGFGGKRVIIDGGCVALPFLHQIQKISMGSSNIRISREAEASLITSDNLRADMQMEFEFRVKPTVEGVSEAAQSLGARISRHGEGIKDVMEGKIIDAMQDAAASRTLDEIHSARAGFTAAVEKVVAKTCEKLGLELESASLLKVDQTTFSNLDENNIFNAKGMRKAAELVSQNHKERVRIEVETDVEMRESRLTQAQKRLDLERAEREAEISQQEYLARLRAESSAISARTQSESEKATESARLDKERDLKAAQIANDELLRKKEMDAILKLEQDKIDNEIALTNKRIQEAAIKANEEESRAQVILAAEKVQAEKERAIIEREREISLKRAQKEIAVAAEKAKSEGEIEVAKAEAAAKAVEAEVRAEAAKSKSEIETLVARIAAENNLSEEIIRMRLEERKLDRMPEIMAQMMKPVEKIDSIKINQIAGLNGSGNGSEAGGAGGVDSAFGAAMDQILGMAVRLPAMKSMGEEIGLDFDVNTAGRTADYANRIKAKEAPTPDKTSGASKPAKK